MLVEPWIRGALKELARHAHGHDCTHVISGVNLERSINYRAPYSFAFGSVIPRPQFGAIFRQARKLFFSICVGCILCYESCGNSREARSLIPDANSIGEVDTKLRWSRRAIQYYASSVVF